MLEINNSYNFQTLAPAILGLSYENLKLKGIVSAEEAARYSDVVTKHEAVKNQITGISDDVNDLTYYIFVNSDNDTIVMAKEYIDPTTIVAVVTLNLRLEIYDITSDMATIVQQRLKELGINTFKATTFTN